MHITRKTAVFEVYNPYSIVQLSEVLPRIEIIRGSRVVYKGRAVVSHILSTGLVFIISTTLVDAWSDLSGLNPGGELKAETERFVQDWNSSHQIDPQYQLATGTLRNFLCELSRWLDEAEAGAIDTSQSPTPEALKEEFYLEVREPIFDQCAQLFEQFEAVAPRIPDEELSLHKAYAHRELHPLILCSPFVHRCYTKPLGYAGDYEMVNMMLGESSARASTIYAKIVDDLHIGGAGPEAHRNRVAMLQSYLEEEAIRVVEEEERFFDVLNVGCGPAVEVQRFVRDCDLSGKTSLQLMDFNVDTLDYTKSKINDSIAFSGNKPLIKYMHKSIDTLLKEIHNQGSLEIGQFDMIYCAGLFDYFSDAICKRLVSIFWSSLRPGGFACVTNVHTCNPNRFHMEHLLDWYLVYRDEENMENLAPKGVKTEIVKDSSDVNVFLNLRKPD